MSKKQFRHTPRDATSTMVKAARYWQPVIVGEWVYRSMQQNRWNLLQRHVPQIPRKPVNWPKRFELEKETAHNRICRKLIRRRIEPSP
jgi:hypothetical protein